MKIFGISVQIKRERPATLLDRIEALEAAVIDISKTVEATRRKVYRDLAQEDQAQAVKGSRQGFTQVMPTPPRTFKTGDQVEGE